MNSVLTPATLATPQPKCLTKRYVYVELRQGGVSEVLHMRQRRQGSWWNWRDSARVSAAVQSRARSKSPISMDVLNVMVVGVGVSCLVAADFGTHISHYGSSRRTPFWSNLRFAHTTMR